MTKARLFVSVPELNLRQRGTADKRMKVPSVENPQVTKGVLKGESFSPLNWALSFRVTASTPHLACVYSV